MASLNADGPHSPDRTAEARQVLDGPALGNSETEIPLGSATLVGGFPLEAFLLDDGAVALWEPASAYAFTLSDQGAEQLHELLGRALMAGLRQAEAAG